MSVDLALVPAAGFGTRLLPCTKTAPKELLPVARKPVVQFVVEELANCGIRRLLFIVGRDKPIERHFKPDDYLTSYLRDSGREDQLAALEFERRGLEFFSTTQREQRGLGDAVLCALPLVGDQPFVVALGDSIIGVNANSRVVARMIDEFDRTRADVVIAFEEVAPQNVVHYGIATPHGPVRDDGVFELADVVEKPSREAAASNLAVAGRYVFRPSIFDALRETRPGRGGEIQLTDAIASLLRDGAKGVGVRLPPSEKRFDIGNFRSYYRAFIEFALADPEYGDELAGFVQDLLRRRSGA
jgi:UTP--glucose-1-phosphate uridylyltransferase